MKWLSKKSFAIYWTLGCFILMPILWFFVLYLIDWIPYDHGESNFDVLKEFYGVILYIWSFGLVSGLVMIEINRWYYNSTSKTEKERDNGIR